MSPELMEYALSLAEELDRKYGRQMLDKPEFPCQPDLYFNLYNNIWGCNQPMWTEGDAQYRFRFLPR